MRTLKTSEAAALLNVSPNTLRTWERRFGYPRPQRSPGRHRLYVHAEITALREALEEGLSISSAVSVAAEASTADGHALVAALASFRSDRADWAMEASLALRPLEASIEQVLLPALAEIRRRKGLGSAAWAFAARWSIGWLGRAERLAPSPTENIGVLIGDASEGEFDPATPFIRAFELCCTRAAARVLTLPVSAVGRLAEPIATIDPDAVVIAGSYASDDDVARWAYGVRRAAGNVTFLLFHRGLDGALVSSRPRVLPVSPQEAQQAVLVMIGRSAPTGGPKLPSPVVAGRKERVR